MPIDLALWEERYKKGTQNNAEFWKSQTLKTPSWQAKAVSEDAENLYSAKVTAAIANKSRQKGVQKVSDGEWKGSVTATPSTTYSTATQTKAPKARKNFAPAAAVIDAAQAALPARVADGHQNLVNRAGPIVDALIAYKKAK